MWVGWCEALKIHLEQHSPLMLELDEDERKTVQERFEQIAQDGKGHFIKPYMDKYEWMYKEGMFGMTAGRLLRTIRRLHEVYTMGVVDKASANFEIECKLFYRKMVLTRLSSPEMELLATTHQQLEGLLVNA